MRHTLGSLLVRHRVDAGLTQHELAQRAAISIRALRDIEQDRVRQPRPQSVGRLLAALGLSNADRDALVEAAVGKRSDARLRVGILGPLTVYRGSDTIDVGSPMQRSLLGLLALHAGQVVSCAEVVDTLWGEDPPKSCAALVHVYVRQLRSLLEPQRQSRERSEIVVRNGSGYQLALDDDQLDLGRFHLMLARARQSADDPQSAFEWFEQALRCWRGPLLANADGRLRHHPAAIAVSRQRLAAALAFADAAFELGRHEATKELLWDLAYEEPLHEGLHARLMLAVAGCGDQAAALRLFADLRTRLADELGVEPGAEVQSAQLRILRPEAPVAAQNPAMPPAQLPLDVHGFTGRAGHLERLDVLLRQRQEADTTALTIVVVAGAPGVGKTALTVHWAHRVAGRFPDGQLYVNLRGFDLTGSALGPAEAVRGFLDALGVTPQHIPADLAAQAALYRSLLVGKRVLIVLDNARDAEQVRPLLPGAPGCLVLVTSRHQLNGLVAAEGAHPLEVDLLTAAEARQLLARRISATRVEAESQAVDDIITRCARLPLALTVVAARAATHSELPLVALAGELRDYGRGLDPFSGDDAVTNVRAVFSWSYEALGGAAARLFRLLGLHPVSEISLTAAASLAGVPLREAHLLLGELDRAHLVSQPAPGRFGLHDLMHAYAHELAHTVDIESDRRAVLHRMFDHYLHSATNATLLMEPHRDRIAMDPMRAGVTPKECADSAQAIAWFDSEHPALRAVVHHAASTGFDRHVWQQAWSLVDYFDRRGRWHDWVATQTAAVEAAQRLADRPQQAYAYRSLARAYAQLGGYEDAQTQLKHALDLLVELGDDEGQAKTHGNIAWVSGLQERHSDALLHAQKALELFRSTGHQVGEGKALNHVGWCHAQLGDHEQALSLCQQALTLQRRIGDRNSEADTLDSLGFAHHRLCQYEQATACYRQAIDLFQVLGERYFEADTLSRLGGNQQAAGDLDTATAAWQRALTIFDELNHPRAGEMRMRLEDVA